MLDETGIRSEKPSLGSLRQALAAIKGTRDTDELAHLLLLVTEVYSDSQCRCEEKEAGFGEESEEALSCHRNVALGRGEILETYKELVTHLKR